MSLCAPAPCIAAEAEKVPRALRAGLLPKSGVCPAIRLHLTARLHSAVCPHQQSPSLRPPSSRPVVKHLVGSAVEEIQSEAGVKSCLIIITPGLCGHPHGQVVTGVDCEMHRSAVFFLLQTWLNERCTGPYLQRGDAI